MPTVSKEQANETISETVEYLQEVFNGKPVTIVQVAAKMPSSCWGRYIHARVVEIGEKPIGHNLKNYKEGENMSQWRKVNVPSRCTIYSELGRIMEAVRIYNLQASK